MNSQELADEVGNIAYNANVLAGLEASGQQIIRDAQARILGIGAEQYAQNDQQKFETMTLDGLLVYFEEELLDQINYAVMNIIRIRRMRAVFDNIKAGVSAEALAQISQSFMGEPKR